MNAVTVGVNKGGATIGSGGTFPTFERWGSGGTRNCDGFAIVRNGKCSLQHI